MAQSIRIKDNDCVFFTNSKPYKHKVDAMKIMNKENMKNIDDGNKDKNGKQIFGTRKLLGFFIIDPEKYKNIKTSKDVIVNFKDKVLLIISYWMKQNDIMQNEDVMNLVQLFVSGKMQYIKM